MLERLNQAMEHIERHLDQPIDAAELARIAATSEYHLRRMFSALAGMPLSEYIRRRRLTLAGAEVLARHDSLLEIAVRYGYGSGEAFARAFRAMHGVAPGEARRTGAELVSQPQLTFRLTVEGSSSMRYRVVERPAFTVVGPKTRVPLIHTGPNQSIIDFVRGIPPRTRDHLEEFAKLSNQDPQGIVAVCDDLDPSRAEGTELDYYHAVITTPESVESPTTPLDDMAVLPVPPGTWAVFTTSGPAPEAIQLLRDDYAPAIRDGVPYSTFDSTSDPADLAAMDALCGYLTDTDGHLPRDWPTVTLRKPDADERAEAARQLAAAGPLTPDQRLLRILLDDDQPTFEQALVTRLIEHRESAEPDPAPRTLLPLGPLALAALAVQVQGWELDVRSGYLPHGLLGSPGALLRRAADADVNDLGYWTAK